MNARSDQPGSGGAGWPRPVLGPVAERWLALRSVEDAGLDEAVGLLAHDAVLRDPVVAWCRAGAGASGERVTTPSRAVIMLGVPAVRAAVVGVSGVVGFNASGRGAGPIDPDGFWMHALAVGAMCERLAPGVPGADADDAGLAGLFHDAGKLVLAGRDGAAFTRAMGHAEQRSRPAALCLREAMGMDHHTAGKRVIEGWRLPAGVRDAVWHHGQCVEAVPASASGGLVALVGLAKAWARANHLGWSGEWAPAPALEPLCEAAGVDVALVEASAPAALGVARDRARALRLGAGRGVDPIAWSAGAATKRSAELAGRLRDITKESEHARVVLDALTVFHSGVRPDDDPSVVVGAIGRSACHLLGVGRVAVVWQPGDDAPWRLSLVGESGAPEKSRRVDRPADNARIRRPADLAGAHASRVLVACELGWLAKLIEHLREAGTPALVGAGAVGDAPGASCLVLAPVARLTHDGRGLEPVTGAWAWALDASARAVAARTLGEELAQANRALAAAKDDLAGKQSMVRLGQMAAGAAHELNNPLTVIRGRAQMISEHAGTPRQREDSAAICEAARQVSDMVSSMHLLSCPPKPRPNDCDPMLILRDAIDRARVSVPAAARKTRVRINADGLPASMRFDAGLVAQLLGEPIANALVSRPGGEVHISIESEAFTDRLKVRIIDRGPGLSARALTHAFDPFFSEQPAGRRAGLGLARARSLAELMGGRIEVANNPGDIGGAYAEVTLPQADARQRAA